MEKYKNEGTISKQDFIKDNKSDLNPSKLKKKLKEIIESENK